MKIDEELIELNSILENLEDTHPDYMPNDLKILQSKVLTVHSHMEVSMDILIIDHVASASGLNMLEAELKKRALFIEALGGLLDRLTFRNKIEILEGYKEISPKLIKSLQLLNKYRNEFAHTVGMVLRDKYQNRTHEGKLQTRNLLRALVEANKEMNSYYMSLAKPKGPNSITNNK